MEWIAQEITEAGGEASIWLAQPASEEQERELASRMAEARATEYAAVLAEARAAASLPEGERRRTGDRLRAELRRVTRRDSFPPIQRDEAQAAVRALLEPAPAEDTAAVEEAGP